MDLKKDIDTLMNMPKTEKTPVDSMVSNMPFQQVLNCINEVMEDVQWWKFTKFTDTPRGKRQECDSDLFDHEYVSQSAGACGDDYWGSVSLPMGDGQYIELEFYC